MEKIELKKKTGCFANNIQVFDFRGVLFYSSDWAGNFIGLFNLPPGSYHINNSIKFLSEPIPIPTIYLPTAERNRPMPKNMKIIFRHNPNKATIYHKKNLIIFDDRFKTEPLYVIWFIYFHELGHKKYYSEHKADLFATKMMFKKGFNESQIMKAPFYSLSSKNHFRKCLILKTLNNNNLCK